METETVNIKADEVALFKDLGLKRQVSMREVQTVMDGHPYYPISTKGLESLFGLRWLKVLTFFHNEKARIFERPISSILIYLFTVVPMLSIAATVHYWPSLYGAPLLGCVTILFAFMIHQTERDRVPGVLDAIIKVTDIDETGIKIPYGAALRYKEAKDKNIFSKFVVAYPNVVERNIGRDPAILGCRWNGDNYDLYMIVYWDIEKDKARAVNQIKNFSKFKL